MSLNESATVPRRRRGLFDDVTGDLARFVALLFFAALLVAAPELVAMGALSAALVGAALDRRVPFVQPARVRARR